MFFFFIFGNNLISLLIWITLISVTASFYRDGYKRVTCRTTLLYLRGLGMLICSVTISLMKKTVKNYLPRGVLRLPFNGVEIYTLFPGCKGTYFLRIDDHICFLTLFIKLVYNLSPLYVRSRVQNILYLPIRGYSYLSLSCLSPVFIIAVDLCKTLEK